VPIKIFRLHIVLQRTGLSRSTIYRLMALGDFPQAVKLSTRAIGWRADEIDAWINSLGGKTHA
jgi:prophage regulatory protein